MELAGWLNIESKFASMGKIFLQVADLVIAKFYPHFILV